MFTFAHGNIPHTGLIPLIYNCPVVGPVSTGGQWYQIHEFVKKITFLVITRKIRFWIYS